METLYSELNILEIIRSGRLRWAGHVCRNQDALHDTYSDGTEPTNREKTVGKTANALEECCKRRRETVGRRI